MKKVDRCSLGGLRELQVALLAEKEITCEACCLLLKTCKFDKGEMDKWVDACLRGEKPVRAPGISAKPKGEKNEEELEELTLDQLPEPEPKKKRGENQDEQIHAWIRTLEPYIQLLPSGTFGKAVPYKCTVCKTPCWPQGFVGECSEMKLGSVQHFVGKHMQSSRHQEAVRAFHDTIQPDDPDESGIPVDREKHMVKCTGIEFSGATSEPHFEHYLFRYHEQVELWGSMTNFEDLARNSYSHNKTSGHWTHRMVGEAMCSFNWFLERLWKRYVGGCRVQG